MLLGHGGPQAAEFARSHLHSNIVHHPLFKSNTEEAIRAGFLTTGIYFIPFSCIWRAFDLFSLQRKNSQNPYLQRTEVFMELELQQ